MHEYCLLFHHPSSSYTMHYFIALRDFQWISSAFRQNRLKSTTGLLREALVALDLHGSTSSTVKLPKNIANCSKITQDYFIPVGLVRSVAMTASNSLELSSCCY
jgi:hypothetical protein